MKKLSCLVISALLLCPGLSQSQSSQVFVVSHDIALEDDMGVDIRSQIIPDGNGFVSVIASGGGMNTTVKLGRLRYSIKVIRVDSSGKAETEKILADGSKNFGPIRPFLRREGNDIYLLYFLFDSEDENSNLKLFAARLDAATLQTQEPKEVLTIDQKKLGRFKVESFMEHHRLILKESPDLSKIAVIWNSGVDNDIVVGVTDSHFARLWSKRETTKYADPVELSDAFLDNSGKICQSYRVSMGHDIYEGHLLIFRENAATIDKNIRIAEGYPWEVNLAPVPSSDLLIVTGTYVGDGEAIAGVFETGLHLTDLSMQPTKVMPVPEDVLELFKKDSWASNKRRNHGFGPIKMLAFAGSNGDLDLIGEFKRVDYSITPKTTYAFWISGDILWVHVAGGKAVYGRIPKARVSTSRLIGGTISVLAGPNGLFVFYNDTEANLKKDIKEEPSRSDHYNNVVLVAGSLDAGGQVRRNKIADLSADHFVAETQLIQPVGPGGILVPFQQINSIGRYKGDFKWVPLDVK
jgi:hypothetical protein